MTQLRFRPIDRLNAEWAALSSSPESSQALNALAAAEPVIDALGFVDLGSLVAGLRAATGSLGRTEAARAFQAMLRSQSVHHLVRVPSFRRWSPGSSPSPDGSVGASAGNSEDGGAFFAGSRGGPAWEVISDWSGEDRQYAILDLLSAVRCRASANCYASVTRLHRWTSVSRTMMTSSVSGSATSGLDLLARTIDDLRGRGLEPSDAAVIYGNRVLGLLVSPSWRI